VLYRFRNILEIARQKPDATRVAGICVKPARPQGGWLSKWKFARTLQKGQLITLEGILRYREVEIHAIGMKRLSKVKAADDPSDGADDE
jgi:hypothetical protein